MDDRPEKVIFHDPDTGEDDEYYVLEQTCIAGITYLLVAEDDTEDCDAYVLRQVKTDGEDVVYEIVDDEDELRAITKVFGELIEDVDFDF